jgi:hypothetical protein
MQPFTLGAGQETFRCQNFANPVGQGQELVFVKSESFMTPGSHHMFVMEDAAITADRSLYECSGLDFKPLVHSAQTPQVTTAYPPGVGVRMTGGGFQVLAHYFNTSTQTINAEVRILLYVANPGEVTRYAAAVFGNVINISVQPYSTGSVTGSCNIPWDIEFLHVVSHMHSHATNFVAMLNGQTLYETTNWDDPPARVFEPPMAVPGGSTITYKCDYNNTTGVRLTFGESAKSNEMCIISGRAITPTGAGVSCLLGL